jgi:hypothetical protein
MEGGMVQIKQIAVTADAALFAWNDKAPTCSTGI